MLTNSCIIISDHALFRSCTNGCLLKIIHTVTHEEVSTSGGGGGALSLGHKKQSWYPTQAHVSVSFVCKTTINRS